MKSIRFVWAIAALTSVAAAQTLYGASGSNGVTGNLYTLNAATGAALTTVGSLVDANGRGYGLTGLAFSPGSGVLYGVTTSGSPTAPRSLVSVDPNTAQVTLIGALNVSVGGPLGDIAFSSNGTLYGVSSFTSGLYTVNLSTGATTLVGQSGFSGSVIGCGIGINSSGAAFAAVDGANLYSVNLGSGALNLVGSLGMTAGHGMNAMAFNGNTLYGLDSDRGVTANVNLVTVNTTTGLESTIGATPVNLDAIAFSNPVPEPATLTALGLGALALLRRRRR